LNLLTNGSFEADSLAPWLLLLNADGQAAGSADLDSTTSVDGTYSAHIAIATAGTANWHIDFEQSNLPLVAGTTYQLQFWAKADSDRWITVSMQGGPPSYSSYGLYTFFYPGTAWQQYTATFIAPVTAADGRLQFYLGSNTGNVWLDEAQLFGGSELPQSITFAAPANEEITPTPVSLIASASSGLPVSFSSGTPAICTSSGNTVTLLAIGTCTITASQAGNSAYTAAIPVVQSFSVEQSSQTIAFPSPGTQALGGVPFNVELSATSGLPVGLVSGTPAVCIVSGTTVTLMNLGACTLTASQPGNASYPAATSVTQSFLVTSNLIVNGGFESGSLAPWALLENSDGAAAGSAALDSTTSAQGASSAHIAIAAAATANWHLNFEQPGLPLVDGATYEVHFWAKADSARSFPVVMQGGAPNYLNYGLYAPVSVSTSWQLYTTSFVATSTASDGRLQFYLGSNTGNVWLDAVQLFNVAGASQTIAFPTPAAQTFGSGSLALNATASSGLTVSLTSTTPAVCSLTASSANLLGVGTCSITASQAGSVTYTAASPVTQSFTVTQEQQSIAFGAIAGQMLGAAPFTIGATASSGLAVTLSSGTLPVCSISNITVTLLAAGMCSISANQSGNANIAAAAQAAQSFAVTKPADTSVALIWDAPSGSADPISGYDVYRALSGSSTYQLLNVSVITSTTYTDNSIQDGLTYDYMVESVDSHGVASAPSNIVGVTVP
jgi:hypothetical protein